GLFPAILNLASNAKISANATCGEFGPEMYCKLVEHVPGRPIRNPQCRICDNNSANPRERHPITKAIDGTNNWWQSPSIQNGREYHQVTVTLDLRQVFQVAYIIIKAANSPRPGNWILERSLDGVEFQPWQFYAISDTECLTRYNITPRLGPPTYKRDDEVICTSYYSRLVPLEHGEIHTSLINGRPSADDPSPTLLDFTSARYIRLRLQRIRTLNADLMTLSHSDPKDIDPIVTRRYYYSIKDISVGGMCICYGHARSCPFDGVTMKLQCQCEHNTCGESCDECCPGYHQKPWRPGTINAGNTCEKCNCHNKTDNCYYDQIVADRNMSMNIYGQFIGGGVCINCSQNTAGINCETCVDGYFRPHKVSPFEANPCLPCDCDPSGSLHAVCVQDDNRADPQHASMICCSQKDYQRFVFSNCGRVWSGEPLYVEIMIEHNLIKVDQRCTKYCGFLEQTCYSLFLLFHSDGRSGLHYIFCFSITWSCHAPAKLPGKETESAQDILKNGLIRLRLGTTHPLADAHDPVPLSRSPLIITHFIKLSMPADFMCLKLVSYGGYLRYTVSYDVPVQSTDSELVTGADVIIEGNGEMLSTRPDGLLLQPYEEHLVELRLLPEQFVVYGTNRPIDRDRLMTVLANVTRLQIRASYNRARKATYRLSSVSLDIANSNAIDLLSAVNVEHCECPPGYTGISCETCSPGFYRVDGILFGGICLPCECNGHATECDIHGVCFHQKDQTWVCYCESLIPGVWNEETGLKTQPCPDDVPILITLPFLFSFSPTCHLDETGEVICDQCPPEYAGPRCERCANGYHGNPSIPGGLCTLCDCSSNVNPSEPDHCDAITGECLKCIGNTSGRHCERCADGYYGDAVIAKNCLACNCHLNSSYSDICDVKNGQCPCKPNVIGRRCDQCLFGYYGLSTGFGCTSCNCSRFGSVSEQCNDNGECYCVPGVTSVKCDQCARGFYDFQEGGCTPCDCSHTQNNCDPGSGQCICPPHTTSSKCELCEANYWGHDLELGCKACNCSKIGSARLQCDLTSGQCLCKPEFDGEKCDRCGIGFRDYPQCIACDCNINGTRAEKCDEKGLCSCEEQTGRCFCKDNAFGSQCSECKFGTFALSAENPMGCSPCFCSGVSQLCTELQDLVRIPITLTPDQSILHVVTQSNQTGTTEGVFLQDPDILLDTATVQKHLKVEPFYWRLPDQFLGEKLLAYGGKLRYAVAFYAFHGLGSSNFEPQILMKGGRTSKLVLYSDVPPPDNGVKDLQQVELKESGWKYFNSVSDQPVTRSDFMAVLSNIEYILIKASYGSRLQQSRISNISMEVAVMVEEMHGNRMAARGIEICDCPPGYTGLSCQECSPGYYRQKLTELNVRGPRPLLAPCVLCQCNNHSEICDVETGKCLGCRDNTVGEHCDVCAPGYYGRVTGSVGDCSPCACPRAKPVSSFSPTCVLEGDDDFRCDACLPGYEGQYCERCSPGYYGKPGEAGGACQQCGCNPNGSVHSNCDAVTGQCLCKQGVMGHLCDECERRHILVENDCISCDDECTGVLLTNLDNLEIISSVNLTGIVPAPYGLLSGIENTTEQFRLSLSDERAPAYLLKKAEEQLLTFFEDIEQMHKQTSQVFEDGQELDRATERTLNQSQELTVFLNKVQRTIEVPQALAEAATNLNETLSSDLQLSNSTLKQLHADVSRMVELMRKTDFTQQQQTVTAELKVAEELLRRVDKEFGKPGQDLKEQKEHIADTVSEHSHNLQEAQDLLNEAHINVNETSQLLVTSSSNLVEFKDKNRGIMDNANIAALLIEEGKSKMVDCAGMAQDVVNSTEQLEAHYDELLLWNTKLRFHVDDLVMQMTQRAVLDLVYRVEEHAAQLQEVSSALNSALFDVRNTSLNATSAFHAHSNIKAMVEEAKSLASEANRTADSAWDLVIGPEGSLEDAGKEADHQSARLLDKAKDTNKKTESLISQLTGLRGKVEKIQVNAQSMSKQLNVPLLLLNTLPNETSTKILEAKERAFSANASAAAAINQVEGFRQKVQVSSSTFAKVNDSLQKTKELITESSKTVVSAETKVKEAEAQARLLLERLKPLKMLEDNLSRNLSEIRELISQARKQAASIKVAVSADGDCIRAYQPEITTSNFNTLTLNVKTTEPDNLLFYLGSSTNTEFLAVEMRRGRVAFLWDVGSGAVRLDNPDIQINNDKWHRIDATRFGKSGSLTIQEVGSSKKPVTKTAASPGKSTLLDINKSTFMFVGGLSGQVKKASAVKVTHFKGCMGEASLNGKSIGLWNYVEREGKCSGCYVSPQDEDISFHFDGSGYSIVEKNLRSTVTQIVMFFSTFSPNGLLLYLVSNGTRDFLSLELVDGKVRLTYDLGSGPLTLFTERRYNNGTWYKIAFQRNRKQ
uniref:Laminin subunit alpha-1 n=1 Tax=Latimeria chalumnae TaxID=7897 RepID=H2ZS58_LATCH